jgi:ATP-binding cassette, subfamily C, bacterial PrsD
MQFWARGVRHATAARQTLICLDFNSLKTTEIMSSTRTSDPVAAGLSEAFGRLAMIAIFSGIINLLTLSGSIYMMQVYDRVIPGRNLATLATLSLIVLLAYLLQGYLDAMRSRMLARLGAMFDVKLQRWLFVALTSLPLQGASASAVHQPLRDLEQVRGFLSGMGPVAFLDMPWIPLFVIILFLFHPLIGMVAVFGTTAIVLLTLWSERRSATSARQGSAWGTQRQVFAEAARRNADVIRAMGMSERLSERWARLNDGAIVENLRSMDVHANLGSVAKVTRQILQSSVLGIGAYLVVNDQASGGIMIASSIIMGRALAPIEIALGTWRQLQAARAGIERLRHVLRHVGEPADGRRMLARPGRGLSIVDLSVTVPGTDRTVISGISLELAAGTGLALIGPSGSGKTSLAKALVSIWAPAQGAVRLDGVALGDWRNRDLGQYLGYLPQDVALFEGTIAENIARFDGNAPIAAVAEAAVMAGAHDMIMALPERYQTALGEGGLTLSAGQRQRIGLARAVFGNPFLIVLDEPNANLDQLGERALNNCLRVLKRRGAIVIVISHRPMVLEAVDMLMVLIDGRMSAFGTHKQVADEVRSVAAGPKPTADSRTAARAGGLS